MKKNGPALIAAFAGSFASWLATLAKPEAAGQDGKSKLAELVDRIQDAVTGDEKSKRDSDKERRREQAELAH